MHLVIFHDKTNKLLKRTKNSWLMLVPRYFSQQFFARLARRYISIKFNIDT